MGAERNVELSIPCRSVVWLSIISVLGLLGGSKKFLMLEITVWLL